MERKKHSDVDAASFAVDDGYSQYLSGIPLVGAIGGAACSGRVPLLAASAAGALGTYRKVLSRALAAGLEVVRPDTVALVARPKTEETVKTLVPSLPC